MTAPHSGGLFPGAFGLLVEAEKWSGNLEIIKRPRQGALFKFQGEAFMRLDFKLDRRGRD